jgi:hypothetical protein
MVYSSLEVQASQAERRPCLQSQEIVQEKSVEHLGEFVLGYLVLFGGGFPASQNYSMKFDFGLQLKDCSVNALWTLEHFDFFPRELSHRSRFSPFLGFLCVRPPFRRETSHSSFSSTKWGAKEKLRSTQQKRLRSHPFRQVLFSNR